MNIVSRDELDSDKQFEALFRSLPRVILEGDSDLELFVTWFEHLGSELEFVTSEAICDVSGCTGVPTAVARSSTDDGIPAIGIVDRDRLNREHRWEELFSTNDAPPGYDDATGSVYTTGLWEIEAYLFQPELLGRWVGTQRKPPPATLAEKATALRRTLEETEALLSAMPFFASGHASGVALHPKYFSNVGHGRMIAACAAAQGGFEEDRQRVSETVQRLVDAVWASAPDEPAERLVYLLRYVDTKRLLNRVGIRLGLHEDAHHALAELMSISGARPAELENVLEQAIERFAA